MGIEAGRSIHKVYLCRSREAGQAFRTTTLRREFFVVSSGVVNRMKKTGMLGMQLQYVGSESKSEVCLFV